MRARGRLARVGKSCLDIFERRKVLTEEIEKHVSGFSKLESKRYLIRKKRLLPTCVQDPLLERVSTFEIKRGETERELEELVNTWEDQYPYPGIGIAFPRMRILKTSERTYATETGD